MTKNFFEFQIWKKERAEEVILNYLQGLRKISLNWVLGYLKGDFGLSKEEVLAIIKKIRENPFPYLLDKFPERKIRLRSLEKALAKWEKIPSFKLSSVKAYK